jgi:hypothetical protein
LDEEPLELRAKIQVLNAKYIEQIRQSYASIRMTNLLDKFGGLLRQLHKIMQANTDSILSKMDSSLRSE